ncbi:hypothetical protein [Microvirga massiliensis]|uniref:hypothetical protein n=1 Tax=Microvirga massiliensis TaxID=1033741 RepID=UPI00062B862C|nr:hypothetical protein [Microvirga massiliensis]
MTTTLAAIVALAQTTTLASSDGENANRVRASIYDTAFANQAASPGVAVLGETRAQARVRMRSSSIPMRIRRGK